MARGFSMQDKLLAKTKPLEEPAATAEAALDAVEVAAPVETPAAAAEAPVEVIADPAVETAEPEQKSAGEKRTSSKRPRQSKRTPETAPASVSDAPAPETASAPASAKATEPASAGLPLDVEPALDARLMAYRASTRLSLHHIVLDAVEQTYPQLSSLVAKALGRDEESARPKTSLFQRASAPAPLNIEGKSERITHTIRIARSNRDMLDRIAEEVRAPSRNFMLCVALDQFLPKQS